MIKKYIHLVLLWILAFRREARRWIYLNGKLENGVRIYYGVDSLATPDEYSSGGIVKFQDLQKIYPNHTRKPNVLYLTSSALPPRPLLVARLSQVKGRFVLNQNGVAFPAYHGDHCETINGPRRELLHRADYVIYQSNFSKVSSEIFLGKRTGPSEVLYNAVDLDVYKPSGHELVSKIPVMLISGSHHFWYRVESAVKTIAALIQRHHKVKLFIMGRLAWREDPDICERELLDLCNDLEITDCVRIIGPYKQTEAVFNYQSADIFLHTKVLDCCPRVVLEALACGLPVIYANNGGVPELVGKDSGIGVSIASDWNRLHPPDPKDMAAAALKIMASYKDYSQAARARAAAHFDVRQWLQRHKEIFNALISGSY